MSLAEVRKEINKIDEEMKGLYEARMECTRAVAEEKQRTGDRVFKPEREAEIYSRYTDDPYYISFIKKVVQLSRKRQYEILLADDEDERFINFIREEIKDNVMHLTLRADKAGENGLDVKGILSIISDTSLEIKKLNMEEESYIIQADINVPDDEVAQREAYVLRYMLDEETLKV